MKTGEFCKFLEELSVRADAKLSETANNNPTALPKFAIDEINACIAKNQVADETLHAIRAKPYDHHDDPYFWLWMLHRYMNHYWHK
jgi:hypothetical protein